jgi:hypothetical protein
VFQKINFFAKFLQSYMALPAFVSQIVTDPKIFQGNGTPFCSLISYVRETFPLVLLESIRGGKFVKTISEIDGR